MRKLLIIAGVAVLAVPSIAAAQPGCRQQQHDNLVASGPAVNCDYQLAGYYDDNGVWHAGDGYYDDNGAWHAASGHYDGDGNWVDGPRPAPPAPPAASDYNADVAYVGPAGDLSGREDWMEQRIQRGADRGALSKYDADGDLGRLASIRDTQRRLRDDHDGLTDDDRSDLSSRLDDLGASINAQWRAD
jgi:hypothetical protein